MRIATTAAGPWTRGTRGIAFRVSAVLGLTFVAVVVRGLLDPVLDELYPFAVALFSVLVAAVYLGLWYGVLAALLNIGAVVYLFIPPRGTLLHATSGQMVGQLLNLSVGIGIAILGGRMRAARDRADAAMVAVDRERLQLQAVLDNALDSIITIDARGCVESFNPAAERLFGYVSAEVVGQNVSMLMPEPYRGEHDQYLENYLETGHAKIIGKGRQVQGRRKDGSIVPVDLSVSEFLYDGKRHFTGVLHDLTMKQSLESQLRSAQKMEAFGQLAGGVAHDFNNLLTIIIGYSEMLLDQEVPQKELVGDINQAGQRAAALTRQLLAFSRKQLLEPAIVDLNDVVLGVEAMLRRIIGEDIQLHSRLDMAIDAVRVDRGQMEQVLLNLAVNARDAMPNGGKITMETAMVEWRGREHQTVDDGLLPGRYVMLSMSDTGVGMTEQVKAQIFEPFFTTKEPGKGTGLGLATVFGIIKQSEGHITVYSEVDVGTVFKMYLPAIDKRTDAARPAMAAPRPLGGTETILLVEDEEKVREAATLILTSRGYRVIAAESGEAALELLDAAPRIALVLTDVVMRGMNGRQMVGIIRSRQPGIKVLYMSGYTDDAVVRHGVIEAKEAFLQKPFTPFTLTKKVREVLDAGQR